MGSLLGTEDLWPWLLAVILLPAIFQISTLPICPESPKFILLNRGKEIEAQQGKSPFPGIFPGSSLRLDGG